MNLTNIKKKKKKKKKKVDKMKNELLTSKVPLEKLVKRLFNGSRYLNKSSYVLLLVNNPKSRWKKFDYVIIKSTNFSLE